MAYEAPGLDPPVPSADRLPLSGAEPGRETESAEAGGGAPARQEGPGRCALRGRHSCGPGEAERAPGGAYGTVSPGLSLLPVNSWTRLSQPGLCAGAWSCSSEEPGGRSGRGGTTSAAWSLRAGGTGRPALAALGFSGRVSGAAGRGHWQPRAPTRACRASQSLRTRPWGPVGPGMGETEP